MHQIRSSASNIVGHPHIPWIVESFQTAALGVNAVDDFHDLVDLVVSRLAKLPSTIGIVLLGGLGVRQFIDEFSDLDIAVFTERDAPNLPPFSFNVIHRAREIEFNITQHAIATQHYPWELEKRSAYRNGAIVHDPSGAVQNLLQERLRREDGEFRDELVRALNQIYWKGVRHSRAAAARGFAEAAHSLLNQSLDLVVEAIFCLNRRERPHAKWRIDALFEMAIKPANVRARLSDALLVHAFTREDVERRAVLVESLRRDLEQLAAEGFTDFPAEPYNYWARFLSGRQLRSDNLVDEICEKLLPVLPHDELTLIRGSLSMAILTGSETLDALFAAARSDGLVELALLDKALSALRALSIAAIVTAKSKADG